MWFYAPGSNSCNHRVSFTCRSLAIQYFNKLIISARSGHVRSFPSMGRFHEALAPYYIFWLVQATNAFVGQKVQPSKAQSAAWNRLLVTDASRAVSLVDNSDLLSFTYTSTNSTIANGHQAHASLRDIPPGRYSTRLFCLWSGLMLFRCCIIL